MRKLYFFAFFLCLGFGAWASLPTDYYRSVNSGDWNLTSTWESSPDNINWSPADLTPDFNARTIYIRTGHIVTITNTIKIDQVLIQNGGVLTHNAGVLTINDDISGDDLVVQNGGIFILAFASNPPVFSPLSATATINSGGILKVAAGGLTGSGVGVNASNFIYQDASVLEMNVSFSTSGITYFPNVNATTIPIFRITASVLVGAGSATIINGVLEVNSTVRFQNPGTKTFRNGIRGTGDIIALASSGKFIINGLTAELGGTGSLTVPPAGLEIGVATHAALSSNKTITGNLSLLADTYVDLGNNNLTVSGIITGGAANAYIKTSAEGFLTLSAIDMAGKLLPVGNASYNPLFISNGNLADYSAKVENGINNPAVGFPTYGINRTWYIKASVVTPGVTVSFQYTSADANAGVPQPQLMEILRSDYTIWNILAGNTGIFPAGSNPYTITTAAPFTINSTFSPYALGKNGGWILPLDHLITCRAQKINNSGLINWNTDAGTVNDFEVQRSVNNSAFQTIATVIPGNNQLDYNYTDGNLINGTNLYRIKVNLPGGTVQYSNTVAIINDSKGILITSVSPNPVRNEVLVTVHAASAGGASFKIYNIAGSLVKQWHSNIVEGNNNIKMDMSELPAGIYCLVTATIDFQTVVVLVKQ